MTGSSDRLVEALARLALQANSPKHTHAGAHAPLTIALSRQAGAGGLEVAQSVSARLGWPVYDHELLDRIAEEEGLSSRLLERLDERYIGWLEETVRLFGQPQSEPSSSYLRALLGVLAALGKTGHCIIVGHGAPQVLPVASTLRVRIIAPREMRIEAAMKGQNTTHAKAVQWIDETERDRQRFVHHYFNARDDDPLAYDLVLNRARLSADACANLIVQATLVLEPRS